MSVSKTAKEEEEMEKKWLMKTHVKEVCSSYKSGTSMVLHEQQQQQQQQQPTISQPASQPQNSK